MGSRRAASRPLLCQPHPLELGDEKLTPASWRLEGFGCETAGERVAAERADQCPFLVGEVDRFEGHRQLEPRVLDGAENLERAQDAERAVVAAALPDGVEMGAEEERSCTGSASREDRRVVCGRVDLGLEPRGPRRLEEPGARGEVRSGEGRARDTAFGRGPELRERLEVGPETVAIDAKHHRGPMLQRPGRWPPRGTDGVAGVWHTVGTNSTQTRDGVSAMLSP